MRTFDNLKPGDRLVVQERYLLQTYEIVVIRIVSDMVMMRCKVSETKDRVFMFDLGTTEYTTNFDNVPFSAWSDFTESLENLLTSQDIEKQLEVMEALKE